MTAHPRAALFLVTELARRLELAYRKIASFAFDDVRARVAQALLDYAKPQGDVWINVVGSEELARIVGASREMVSRVLKGMATIGLIRRARRTVVIPAREALLNACVHRPPSPDTHRQHGRSSQTTSAVM
jgi:CRP-like cAMP-binding protein